MNRREVQAALNSRDDSRSYGRDRQFDYDRRGGGFGDRRDMGRDGGRFRRDSPPRGGQRRDRSPVRRRSPMSNRGSNNSTSNNRRSNSRNRRSRDRSRGRNQHEKSDSKSSRQQEEPKPQDFKCELCNIKFNSNEEKVEHEERNEKHINVMKRLQAFSESSGTTMDELIERFLKSRKQTSDSGAVSSTVTPSDEKTKEDEKGGDRNIATSAETNEVKAVESEDKKVGNPENDPNRFPGLFYTGERWRVRVYNPDLILGSDFIVPATGWYCVLCQKFYYSESPAKTSHCRNKSHWENLRSWLKINGHRYEPNQYEKFLQEEERHKEELRNKRKQTEKTDNESEKSHLLTDASSQGGEMKVEIKDEIKSVEIGDAAKELRNLKKDDHSATIKDERGESDKAAAAKEEEIDPGQFGGPAQEIYFETDIGSPIKEDAPVTDTGCDDALDFDYEEEDYDEEGALISRNKDLESKSSVTGNDNRNYRQVESTSATDGVGREEDEVGRNSEDQEGKSERFSPSTVESTSNRTRDIESSRGGGKDADMLMMFDNLEEILNKPEEEEITVNVVEEDAFQSPSRQSEGDLIGATEVLEDLQEPPIEEIRMDNGDDDLFDYEVREEDDVMDQQSPPKQRVSSEEVENPSHSSSDAHLSQPPALSIIEDLPTDPELTRQEMTPASPVEQLNSEVLVPSPTRLGTRRGSAVGSGGRVSRGARRMLRR
ncbi:uncharacterized protein LOC142349759 isoform X3 [Convolutriloba macropyga]